MKNSKLKKYANEHNKDPNWFRHKKHILIMSWAGRPIFTRYGDDSALSAYMGVVSAIISNFQKTGDSLRSIVAGDHTLVFLLKGPIYLLCISRTTESIKQLTQQLTFIHGQILTVSGGNL